MSSPNCPSSRAAKVVSTHHETRWAKNDNSATGPVNEADSIQPKDTGQFYRQVDCKYIYNLDVSSLNGPGTYTVWVRINNMNIQVPATFDLK
jgi:hypothetical protein